uniref:Synaptobrevin, longin-like domain protein n=1 Tax=Tanacetum cinerariifolium TaxID=118510 RepID=A0A6L2K810_TANCI|nr:hypothetical protein [Tanacetum cinerariifolium]
MALIFADTHNMTAYLTKSDASEGFDQIIDFLNASAIKYALTVNPNIYVSCIKHFWSSVSVKKVNDVTRLQALTDRKKVIISEATVREALRLNDAESMDCLPNEEIFTELSRMGYEKPSTKLTFYKEFFSQQWKFLIHTILQCMSAKRTSRNEFRSSMASAVICLSTGRKFNFSKYIFNSLVRNVDSSIKFYMYPRFLQLMIRAQVGDLSYHTTKYSSPALTQKVFANMRRVGKGFSGVETLLFESMIVAQQVDDVADEVAAGVDVDDVPVADGEIIDNIDADEGVTLKDVTAVEKTAEIEKDYFNSNVAFLEKTKEQLEEEESRALKRTSESLEEKVAKKQKLDEEVEELKKHLQILPNDDDNVYTEATSCSQGQKIEIVRVMWSAYHNIYNCTDDLASREKISIDKVYFRSDAEQSLELMLLKTSKIYTKGLRLLVEDLLLPIQIDAAG